MYHVGLPHAHITITLKKKIRTPSEIDEMIWARIPDPELYPELYAAVTKHMIHKCKPDYCLQNNKCNKRFPMPLTEKTYFGQKEYVFYKRPFNLPENASPNLDNRYVAPYNPSLLLQFNCHLYVDKVHSWNLIKYMFLYFYKGDTMANVQLYNSFDEIQGYLDGKYICANEALWHLFQFPIHNEFPSVLKLQVHLPNERPCTFDANDNICRRGN